MALRMFAGWLQGGASDAEGAEAPAAGYAAPVKNTFIHYECDEQPDYRPAKSGPARVEEHRTTPLRAMSTISSQEEAETASNAPTDDVTTGGGSPSSRQPPLPPPSLEASEPPPVKNTFIHFDDAPQPDYTSTVSGPAVLRSVASPPQRRGSEGHLDEALAEADEFQEEEDEEEVALPSVGSAGHATGNCRPCAHAWKDAGCSKGAACTFCHLCEADDFRRRRKEKTQRMKAERTQRKKGDKEAEPPQESAPRPVGPVLAPAAAAPQVLPNVGELLTYYDDTGGVCVRWCVDLRRMASQYRYGTSRRFAIRLSDAAEEVPFVVFFNPAPVADEATPVFVANNLRATLQVKCTDPSLVSERLDIRFDIEGLPGSHLAQAHNFPVEPLCVAQGASWPLQGSREALVRLELRLSRR